MKKLSLLLALLLAVAGCSKQQPPKTSTATTPETSATVPAKGPFSRQELQKFSALDPIDAHAHVYVHTPALYAMLKRLNLHLLDILVDDDTLPEFSNFSREERQGWVVVHGSDGYVALCTTFNPFTFNQPGFAQNAIRKLNKDFSKGAVAVKLYKNVGMEIKDTKGNYIMPDNPVFEPIFKNIAVQRKTLITHLADPDSAFEAPNPSAPDYDYLLHHPKMVMYGKPGAPTKAEILAARDRILQRNPKLRMVGAHLGSMESNFTELGQHLDKYPNLAVDMAARMAYFERQPRAKMIAFITRYQDRLIYGTDNEFYPPNPDSQSVQDMEDTYANDWRYLATNGPVLYRDKKVEGLDLPQSILRKIYHDNAVKWYPGILKKAH